MSYPGYAHKMDLKQDEEEYRAEMYEQGMWYAPRMNRPHPSWINPWFLMGFWDAKGINPSEDSPKG